ncbi:helix-turn-helix domain-containing protein [Nonomuraea sp. CA-141351]|uniref:helix-turn-helix domain-containing protein n=1 Tax=Nonomuraea sp. CA-141351 TaxID=3239996 RepID=UPI003D909C81
MARVPHVRRTRGDNPFPLPEAHGLDHIRLARADDPGESFLGNRGHVQRTAVGLCDRRVSVYYRLRRIEKIAGVDLSNGDDASPSTWVSIVLRWPRLVSPGGPGTPADLAKRLTWFVGETYC